MARGKRTGGGSRKGIPNKITATARQGILYCFDGMGGLDSFVKWAREHPTEFYTKLYARLAPLDMQHSGSVEVTSGEIRKLIVEIFGGGEEVAAPVSSQVDTGREQI